MRQNPQSQKAVSFGKVRASAVGSNVLRSEFVVRFRANRAGNRSRRCDSSKR